MVLWVLNFDQMVMEHTNECASIFLHGFTIIYLLLNFLLNPEHPNLGHFLPCIELLRVHHMTISPQTTIIRIGTAEGFNQQGLLRAY